MIIDRCNSIQRALNIGQRLLTTSSAQNKRKKLEGTKNTTGET